MKKLMVYSHDTFGLGNIRRMLAISEHLLASLPDLSILLITGSPMVHDFRIPKRLDYIKLPCLSRKEREGYAARSMRANLGEIINLRSDLILAAMANFKPDLVLVDKKPFGVENELQAALRHLHTNLRDAKVVLLLRDILDSPEATKKVWEKNGYYEAIRSLYDLVLVVGLPEVFDLRHEYRFPPSVAKKVRFCGYIRRVVTGQARDARDLERSSDTKKRVLVTSGGGEDGYHLLSTYLKGLSNFRAGPNISSLLVCGPEMPRSHHASLFQTAATHPLVQMCEFTNDMLRHMDAADVIVSMGGYNTVCEILSLKKPAIIVPRIRPVAEQWIRAERMAQLGLLQVMHPDRLTPHSLIRTMLEVLDGANCDSWARPQLDLGALPRITGHLGALLGKEVETNAA
ncbi:MAG: glycosyltransferase family protein [Candidatus Binatia bacterium]